MGVQSSRPTKPANQHIVPTWHDKDIKTDSTVIQPDQNDEKPVEMYQPIKIRHSVKGVSEKINNRITLLFPEDINAEKSKEIVIEHDTLMNLEEHFLGKLLSNCF